MASVKISVSALDSRKAVFIKAAKNTRDVIETIRKARTAVGYDRMFDQTKQSLSKLAELLEKRAAAIEALADAMNTAASGYKEAQTNSVSVVTGFKAHNTDFYGNPVHIAVGAVGAAAGTAGIIGNMSVTQNTVSVQQNDVYYSTASPNGYSVNASQNVINNVTNTYSSQTVIYNSTDNEPYVSIHTDDINTSSFSESSSGIFSGISGQGNVSSEASSFEPITAETFRADISESSKEMQIDPALIAAGAVGAAALVGAAGGISEMQREKSEQRRLERQLKEARKQLHDIESEEDSIRESLSLKEDE